MFPRLRTAVLAACLPLVAAPVGAQSNDRRWEVEFYGGASAATGVNGEAALPAPGAPITTSSPIFPSRQVPSWFFGDGARLLNDVNASFALPQRVTPLDAAFAARSRRGLPRSSASPPRPVQRTCRRRCDRRSQLPSRRSRLRSRLS